MEGRPRCLRRMAQILPLTAEAGDRDEAQQALIETLAGLPERWILLRDRPLAGGVAALLIHPDIGIALVDVAPCDPAAAASELQDFLAQERFAEFFPGDLPIVSVSVAEGEIPLVGEHLAAAFEAAPRLSVGDADWADSVVELLLQPSDMMMTPAGPPAEPPPPRREPPEARAEAASAETPPLPLPEPEDDDTIPLRSEREPPALALPLRERQEFYGDRYFPLDQAEPRRRSWLAGTAIVAAALLLSGAGLAMWAESTADSDGTDSAAQIEVPLAPQHVATSTASSQAAGAAPPQVPPVPPAPPVTMAAKPFVPPPPITLAAKSFAPAPPRPPRPIAIDPLPQRTAAAPTPPPAAAAPAPMRPTTAAALPPPTDTAAPPPPTPAKPRPARRTARVENESKRLMERELEAGGTHTNEAVSRPPIDAQDLPPLDGPAPTPPPPQQDHAAALPPPPPQAAPAAAPGPPIPLRRAADDPSLTGSSDMPGLVSTAALSRDCHSYTADSSLSGRQIPVQGTVCRDSEGQWRVVSEVPQH